MGRDKAWLEFEGRPLIERVIEAARPVVEKLFIVISPQVISPGSPERGRYQELSERAGAEILFDRNPGLGPLGGIETALEACAGEESALVLACDMPFLTTDLLAHLRAEHERERDQILVPLDADNRLQPLSAIYPASCLDLVRKQLSSGRRRVDLLYSLAPTRLLPFAGISHLAGSERFFINLNTDQDYRAALRIEQTGTEDRI